MTTTNIQVTIVRIMAAAAILPATAARITAVVMTTILPATVARIMAIAATQIQGQLIQ
jgi:hypothetical protein